MLNKRDTIVLPIKKYKDYKEACSKNPGTLTEKTPGSATYHQVRPPASDLSPKVGSFYL